MVKGLPRRDLLGDYASACLVCQGQLEFNNAILMTCSERMPVPFCTMWTFSFPLRSLSQLLVFEESKFSLDFYLLSTANHLSLALLSVYPQSGVMDTLSSFSWFFLLYYPTERIGFIVLCCYCRCYKKLESALCWRKKCEASG